jgi:predicted AAA+ superfamily ATPase
MKNVQRALGKQLAKAATGFGALMLTGPRRSGKTTLLRRLYPQADYRLLEDPDVLGRVRADPRAFLDSLKLPAILDEIQNAPELMPYIRARIDAQPKQKGRWLLTGSQEAPLMKGVTESMAGRVVIFQMLPFSLAESPKVGMFKGGFPEVLARPSLAQDWFRSYLQTYLERDVRAVTAVRDLATFRQFMALLASRAGQTLNLSELAGPVGLSVPGIKQWLGILELTGQLILVQPYFENLGKRLVKAPKVYFTDTGLLCHLLGLRNEAELLRSPFLGPLFENFVASEIVKAQLNHGRQRQIYYFRDKLGQEVDFVVPTGAGKLALIEAKATRTVLPKMADPMLKFMKAAKRYQCQGWVVHRGAELEQAQGVAPGVKAVSVAGLGAQVLGLA